MTFSYNFNPNTEGVPAPHLTEEGGAHYAPPLKSPKKSNIFGQGKLGYAISNCYKALDRKKNAKLCTEK